MTHRIDFYGKPGCHLCDIAYPIVATLAGRAGATVTSHDVRADGRLMEAYGELIPVVEVDGREVCHWHADPEAIAAALV